MANLLAIDKNKFPKIRLLLTFTGKYLIKHSHILYNSSVFKCANRTSEVVEGKIAPSRFADRKN